MDLTQEKYKPGADYTIQPIWPSDLSFIDCTRSLASSVIFRHLKKQLSKEVRRKLNWYRWVEDAIIDEFRTPMTPDERTHEEYDPKYRGWIIDPRMCQDRVFYRSDNQIMCRGKLDFFATPPKEVDEKQQPGVWDVKCIHPYGFKKINIDDPNSILDLAPYNRGQLAQLIVYQNGYAEYPGGGIVYVSPAGFDTKIMKMNFANPDLFDFSDYVFHQIKKAWEAITTGILPGHTDELETCTYCPWNMVTCYPPEITEGVQMNFDNEQNQKLVIKLESMREAHTEFEEIEDYLKEQIKNNFLHIDPKSTKTKRSYKIGMHLFNASRHTRVKYDIPDDVKKQHEVEPTVVNQIRIKGPGK